MILKGKQLYLSSPIEHGCDDSWRKRVTDVFTNEFGLTVFDPTLDPKQQWAEVLRQARIQKNFELMNEIAHRFVSKDLSSLDHSHILVAFLPRDLKTIGTTHEIIASYGSKKPTIIICPEGKEWVGLWFYGFVHHKYMFGSWDDVYNYFREVEKGLHNNDSRWAYTCGLI